MNKLWTQGPFEAWFYAQAITGDVIQSAAWSIYPTGPLLDQQLNTADSTQVRVSGLTRNQRYRLSVHIITAGLQRFTRVADILCNEY